MTIAVTVPHTRDKSGQLALFAVAIFSSAALVFALEPMIARMILPLLGGSPGVWNTAMLFFQAALLVGYAYAHLLQRMASVRAQILVHLTVLAVAAVSLPISLAAAGTPPVGGPILWLLGALLVSIGAPFTALCATTPLLQAWYVATKRGEACNPYILYGASNLGSMLALLAYPALAEPLLPLSHQAMDWSWAYRIFFMMALGIGVQVWRSGAVRPARMHARTDVAVRRRLLWVLLAAGPSSLMLGTTTFIANDVASVPLFWVIPLALYLLTFVIAFQEKPAIARATALRWQAAFAILAAALLCITSAGLPLHFFVYLGALFFSALVCHQGLAATRPHPDRLTEFYLLVSLGGVLGGIFNSLLAPVIFPDVHEFPLMLMLVCLARPWGEGRPTRRELFATTIGLAAALTLALLPDIADLTRQEWTIALVAAGGIAAACVSRRALLFTLVVGSFAAQWSHVANAERTVLLTARSFFGVSRVTDEPLATMGGQGVRVLYHGTTVHGAQARDPAFRCQPTTYYAPGGPIGQTFAALQRRSPALTMAVVGLGSGTLASYTRAADRLRYFEIDPEVVRIARDPNQFTFLSACAKGKVDIVLGDARLTMAHEAPHSYDLITLDAFSADNIPTHLLTREAFELYFRALRPGGIILLHISNRNLALEAPASATARAAGAQVLIQTYPPRRGVPNLEDSASQVLLLSRAPAALAPFRQNGAWREANARDARPWSDDYTNVMGAMIDRLVLGQ